MLIPFKLYFQAMRIGIEANTIRIQLVVKDINPCAPAFANSIGPLTNPPVII